jgi:Family of unknown function (DUF6719)
MMNSRPTKLFIVIAACAAVAYGVPVGAQTLKKEPDANQLSCGQKVLLENNTCPADQILQVTGAALIRHLRLMWFKLQEERNTTVSSEISAMTIK